MAATVRRQGKLVLYTGPMASGKTARLYQEQQMAERNHFHKAFSIGHANNKDNVSRGHVLSRSGGAYTAVFVAALDEALARRITEGQYTHVFIDEGQFFTATGERELKDFCALLLAARLSVHVSALNSDFKGDPWPAISHLFALSPKTHVLHAWCDGEACGDHAYFTYRVGDNTELVGVHDKYLALCRNCWEKAKKVKFDLCVY